MAETIQPRPSMLTRIFRDLIAASRRDGSIHRAGLAGGAQLAVQVRDGLITATVKRKGVKVGTTELVTFRRHGSVPDDALVLTPLVQGTRDVDGDLWFYVTLRWVDPEGPAVMRNEVNVQARNASWQYLKDLSDEARAEES